MRTEEGKTADIAVEELLKVKDFDVGEYVIQDIELAITKNIKEILGENHTFFKHFANRLIESYNPSTSSRTVQERDKVCVQSLLTDPDFDPEPWIRKEMYDSIYHNIKDILNKHPEACAFFLDVGIHDRNGNFDDTGLSGITSGVLRSIIENMDYSNETLVRKLLYRTKKLSHLEMIQEMIDKLDYKWISHVSHHTRRCICHMLDKCIEHDYRKIKFDQITSDDKFKQRPCCARKAIEAKFRFGIQTEKFKIEDSKDYFYITAVIKSCPIEDIEYYMDKIDKEDFPELMCFRCGRGGDPKYVRPSMHVGNPYSKNKGTFGSKSGLTLHRKSCDPNNEYEHVFDIANRRLAEAKSSS